MTDSARPFVLKSMEDATHVRCVDVFRRDDGSYGFEEYRRDPEDMGRWSRIGGYFEIRFEERQAAEEAARIAVGWLPL